MYISSSITCTSFVSRKFCVCAYCTIEFFQSEVWSEAKRLTPYLSFLLEGKRNSNSWGLLLGNDLACGSTSEKLILLFDWVAGMFVGLACLDFPFGDGEMNYMESNGIHMDGRVFEVRGKWFVGHWIVICCLVPEVKLCVMGSLRWWSPHQHAQSSGTSFLPHTLESWTAPRREQLELYHLMMMWAF